MLCVALQHLGCASRAAVGAKGIMLISPGITILFTAQNVASCLLITVSTKVGHADPANANIFISHLRSCSQSCVTLCSTHHCRAHHCGTHYCRTHRCRAHRCTPLALHSTGCQPCSLGRAQVRGGSRTAAPRLPPASSPPSAQPATPQPLHKSFPSRKQPPNGDILFF